MKNRAPCFREFARSKTFFYVHRASFAACAPAEEAETMEPFAYKKLNWLSSRLLLNAGQELSRDTNLPVSETDFRSLLQSLSLFKRKSKIPIPVHDLATAVIRRNRPLGEKLILSNRLAHVKLHICTSTILFSLSET